MRPTFMLDTNIVSDLVRHPLGRVAQRLAEAGISGACVSVIVAAELRFGAAKKGVAVLSEAIENVLDRIEIVAFDIPADREYARIRSVLENRGMTIGPNDLFIAAHALALDATNVEALIVLGLVEKDRHNFVQAA